MIHALLSAYLSIAVLLGPAICCCTLGDLFPASVESSSCTAHGGCRSHHAERSSAHTHLHRQSHRQHGEVDDVRCDQPPRQHRDTAPCNHGPEECPCDQHTALLAAPEHASEANLCSLEFQKGAFVYLHCVPLASLRCAARSLCITIFAPVGVYGRGMLRAFNKLQC